MKTEKIPESHFERYQRAMRELIGVNPVAALNGVLKAAGREWGDVDEADTDAFLATAVPGYKQMERDPGMEAKNSLRTLRAGLFHSCHFDRHKRIFRLEEGLTQRLLHTDIERVDSSFVKSPFTSIFLSTPYNQELLIPNGDGSEVPVDGIYIWFKGDVDTSTVFTDKGYKNSVQDIIGGAESANVIKTLAVGRCKDSGTYDPMLFYSTFFLAPGDVFPQVEATVARWATEEKNKPYIKGLFKFVLNVLLYITAPEAEFEDIIAKFEKAGSGDPKQLEKKNKGLSKLNQVSVGSSIRILRGMDSYYAGTSINHRIVGCPKWLVRGHWRNQAHGAGRVLRKMTWIQPHEKGEGIAAQILERDYHVA